jgi:Aerotolerance regulator N-terminal
MIWLHPVALLGLASAIVPILIHILVQRRAERFPFPTLRFIAPTRLAAIRRHLLEDAALLAVRLAMLAAAAVALAGPLLVTAARHGVWDRRIARAIVVGQSVDGAEGAAAREAAGVFRAQRIDAAALTDGIRRATAWLDAASPARKELVVIAPFAIGSLTSADVAAIPVSVGVRFERIGRLPPTRAVDGATMIASESGIEGAHAVTDRVIFDGSRTSVVPGSRQTARADTLVRPHERAAWPIEIRGPREAQRALDAAADAVLSLRVWLPPPNHRIRFVAAAGLDRSPEVADATSIREPWMAEAVARITKDDDLRAAASKVETGLRDARYDEAPWTPLVTAADGYSLAVAAGSPSQLIVVSGADALDLVTPLLLRAIVNSAAILPDFQRSEIVPIPDVQLRDWSRPAPPIGTPALNRLDEDDRRWLWLAVLALLALETWMRRTRSAASARHVEKAARVA